MAHAHTAEAVHFSPIAMLDPDRAGAGGVMLSAVLPLAGLMAVNAGAEMMGLRAAAPAMAWMAIAPLVFLPLWGVARWQVVQRGEAGHAAGRWIIALMAAAIVAPWLIAGADTLVGSMITMVVMLIGVAAAARAAMVSKLAAALLLPGLLWAGAGAVVGFGAAAGGWSPPFGLTNSIRS